MPISFYPIFKQPRFLKERYPFVCPLSSVSDAHRHRPLLPNADKKRKSYGPFEKIYVFYVPSSKFIEIKIKDAVISTWFIILK
jgi:hypothetical protein